MSDQQTLDKENLRSLVESQLNTMRDTARIVEKYDYTSDLDLRRLREQWEDGKLSYDEYDATTKPLLARYKSQFIAAEEELFKIGHDSIPIAFQQLLQSENPQPIDFELFGHLADLMSTPENLPVLTEALELAVYKECNRVVELRKETPDPDMSNVWGGIHRFSELQKDPYAIYHLTEAIIRNIYTVYEQNNGGIKGDFGKLPSRLEKINEVLIKEVTEKTSIQLHQPGQSENIFIALALLKHRDPTIQEYLGKYNFIGALGDDMSQITKDWSNLPRIYQIPKRGMLLHEGRYPFNEYINQGLMNR